MKVGQRLTPVQIIFGLIGFLLLMGAAGTIDQSAQITVEESVKAERHEMRASR